MVKASRSNSRAAPTCSSLPRSTQPPVGRDFNPRRLDVAALAAQAEPSGPASPGQADAAGALSGRVPVREFQRVLNPGEPAPAEGQTVDWQARARWRPVKGGSPELLLHLSLQAVVSRTCQRCLQPVALGLQAERDFLFAPTEELAESWDAQRDDADVLVLTRSLNLLDLIEDELLLALPLVPRHEACPEPLPVPTDPADQADESQAPGRANPFAVLAQLKRGG